MTELLDTLKLAGLVVGPLGFLYGIYQKVRADRITGRGDAPFLKLKSIELKGGPERDDRWGTEKANKTIIEFKESWIGPDFSVPRCYPSGWPIVLHCSNEGESVRQFQLRKKPAGFRVATDVHDALPSGDDVLKVHFDHRESHHRTQKFGFRFETKKGRVGYQEYRFDRLMPSLARIKAR